MYLALTRSQLTWARNEVLCTQTMTSAPFGTKAHFGNMAQAAEQFFANFDMRSDRFQYYYPGISFQLHDGMLPVEYGTAEHMAHIREMCEASRIFASAGTKTKSGRWYQIFEKGHKFQPWWKTVEMMLCYIGLHQGWLTHVDEADVQTLLPGGQGREGHMADPSSSGATPAALDKAAPPAVSSSPKAVALSNTGIDKKMAKCRNYLHVAFMILRNDGLRSLWLLLQAVTEPQKHAHGRTLVMCETRQGGGTVGLGDGRGHV